jgi:hypothetical protein
VNVITVTDYKGYHDDDHSERTSEKFHIRNSHRRSSALLMKLIEHIVVHRQQSGEDYSTLVYQIEKI